MHSNFPRFKLSAILCKRRRFIMNFVIWGQKSVIYQQKIKKAVKNSGRRRKLSVTYFVFFLDVWHRLHHFLLKLFIVNAWKSYKKSQWKTVALVLLFYYKSSRCMHKLKNVESHSIEKITFFKKNCL